MTAKKELDELNNKHQKIVIMSGVIAIVSFLLMCIAQSFTPMYMNPLGVCFAAIWLFSGINFVFGLMVLLS